ncbi:hypothetical protein [Brevibacillus fulvus]|uniref:Uncharacterized protein n=1 Tax=Brevibacillus fulvus TaxID=1125967 RepID=A0A938XXX7_9BACL|nr:hypothetical protein [Brevibacillus fulvus]MBM7588486.1 hypothetical protein [Brevibacillus fulvus]
MKRTIKVTIRDFSKLEENLNDPNELKLYESANGQLYEAEIEHDGYAVIDLTDEDYIELAPDEYEYIIAEWTPAGTVGEMRIETKSDPADDAALLYRGVDAAGNELQAAQSLPKALIAGLAKTWFGDKKDKKNGVPE